MTNSKDPNGNIFLTTENLAFSLPLLIVCSSYAYFKYVPLHIGLPILGVLFILYQISSSLKKRREHKLQNLGEKEINDLALELSEDSADSKSSTNNDGDKKLQNKKKTQLQQRLAAERKKKAKKGGKDDDGAKTGGGVDDDDDGDDELLTFAKGSRGAGGKKKN